MVEGSKQISWIGLPLNRVCRGHVRMNRVGRSLGDTTMTSQARNAAQYLALEQQQLYYFLTAVRPVGEEKSELYPEPQYFNTAFISVAAQLPLVLDEISRRTGGPEQYGQKCRRVLSTSTALHLSGLAFLATWGREMWLLDEPNANQRTGVIGPDTALTLSDHDVAKILDFSHRTVTHYRQDGQAYPNSSGALGADYRILDNAAAESIAKQTVGVDADAGFSELRLLASIRALSFLMEGETREALMMHGPYPLGGGGEQLVLFECCDLNWSLFVNFPIPGDVRWALPPNPFPVANLAIALVLRDIRTSADRFGTLYIDPLTPKELLATALLTRGTDEFRDDGLSAIPVGEAKGLGRLCDEIQEHMFLQIASWDVRLRMAAGVLQEHMLLLRMLNAAGFSRAEIESEQKVIFERSAPVVDRYFERSLARPVEKLPFYGKLGTFAAGQAPAVFTPFIAADDVPGRRP